mmetsp:Transcript_35486/g.73024  ORF Transcript_35486/g.73024 Transcript_35486/m.73024 type:complete len:453 (+) Transcript_35486:155-1513(+)
MKQQMLRTLLSLLCLHTVVCFLPLCVRREGARQPASRAQLAGRTVSVRSRATNKRRRWLCTRASGEQESVSDLSAATPLRFTVGEDVIVNTGLGTVSGVVVKRWYREPGWPENTVAPYQIELDDGRFVYAVEDNDVLVRAAGAEPFEERYPPVALHPELFAPENVDGWFLPELRQALAQWQQTGDVSSIDISAFPGLRLEAPGVVSFQCLQPSFCDQLLAEAKHYTAHPEMPQRAPNSMHNYGVVLNAIGMRPSFDQVLQRYMCAIGALFFGDDHLRATHIGSELAHLHNLGGASLDEHHTFIVRYSPEQDRDLDMHVDDCDITFNFGLSDSHNFGGSDLAFCGMSATAQLRQHVHTYSHSKGRCILHAGKRRHGALAVTRGERASLIMWTKSSSFRQTAAYQQRWGALVPVPRDEKTPDRICLSFSYDRDFDTLSRRLGVQGMRSPTQGLA